MENNKVIYKQEKKEVAEYNKRVAEPKRGFGFVTYIVLKRAFDIVCSLFGILFLIPITVVVKILFLITGDYYPIFFTQKRIGKGGKEFNLFKFRSMVPNADEILVDLLKNNPDLAEEYSLNKKLENDPRITKIGNILRKTSIDEFPQFLNVLIGDMAIIGNRPYLPREKEDMGEFFDEIVKTKCGIVSYWAVNGRNDISFEQRLVLEKYYSNNRSLKLDLKIFFSAFGVVLSQKGVK